jgi:hypothetical protein
MSLTDAGYQQEIKILMHAAKLQMITTTNLNLHLKVKLLLEGM